jgi:aminoglycoside 6'-N-acetyltransferase I
LLKSRHGLEIRAASSADAAGLSELLGMAGCVIAPRVLAERIDAVRREPVIILIAVEWGPPSGFVIANWYRTLHADQPTAQITALLVAPDERRRGIGRLLIKAAARAARAAGCDVLEVLGGSENPDLDGFCRATGFVGAGPRFVRGLRRKG